MIDSVQNDREGWLPLRDAAKEMGVSATTLRAWADDGRVQTYRTPGGHRRFRLGRSETGLGDKPRAAIRWRLLEHSALGRMQIELEEESQVAHNLTGLPPNARSAYRKAGRELVHLLTRGLEREQGEIEAGAAGLGQTYAKLNWQHRVPLADAIAGLGFFRTAFLESLVEFAFGVGEPNVDQLSAWLRKASEIIDQVCQSMLEYPAEDSQTRARK